MPDSRALLRDPATLPRLVLAAVGLSLLWPSLRFSEFDLGALLDPANRETLGRFLSTFLPIAHSPEFLALLARSTLQTLAIATAGMALALLLGCPLALVVTGSLSISRIGPGPRRRLGDAIRLLARWTLTVLRSIPEIVWAMLFVRAIGLGPGAGVLAIAITYGGMLGKVYSEILESADPMPARALVVSGSGRLTALLYGLVPTALPELVSYSVYRWECAIRASAIMGFVGAGGLGMQMELSLRMMEGGEVAAILLVFLLLVSFADAVSSLLRRAIG